MCALLMSFLKQNKIFGFENVVHHNAGGKKKQNT